MSTGSDIQLRSPCAARIVLQCGARGKTIAGGVKRKTRTEIRVETYELLAIRKRAGLAKGWDEHCGKHVAMLSLEEAARANLSQGAVYHKVEAGRLHFIEITEAPLFICLNSLME
jgi:hypothetical protein